MGMVGVTVGNEWMGDEGDCGRGEQWRGLSKVVTEKL